MSFTVKNSCVFSGEMKILIRVESFPGSSKFQGDMNLIKIERRYIFIIKILK